MVQRWKSEIDMLLVFVSRPSPLEDWSELSEPQAGLFSAVLTAFNVQSYQLLQPDEQSEMLATLMELSQWS